MKKLHDDLDVASNTVKVLRDMLKEVDVVTNPEALDDPTIDELSEQCAQMRPRVVSLVQSVADESLMMKALSLNDELSEVAQKRDALRAAASADRDTRAAIVASMREEEAAARGHASSSETPPRRRLRLATSWTSSAASPSTRAPTPARGRTRRRRDARRRRPIPSGRRRLTRRSTRSTCRSRWATAETTGEKTGRFQPLGRAPRAPAAPPRRCTTRSPPPPASPPRRRRRRAARTNRRTITPPSPGTAGTGRGGVRSFRERQPLREPSAGGFAHGRHERQPVVSGAAAAAAAGVERGYGFAAAGDGRVAGALRSVRRVAAAAAAGWGNPFAR